MLIDLLECDHRCKQCRTAGRQGAATGTVPGRAGCEPQELRPEAAHSAWPWGLRRIRCGKTHVTGRSVRRAVFVAGCRSRGYHGDIRPAAVYVDHRAVDE